MLCEIIEQAGKVAALAYRDDARYSALLDAGLIQHDGVVQSVLCENCDAPHDAEIVFEGGSYGHFCPELGFFPVERTELVAVRPELTKLADQLHVAFECQSGTKSQLGSYTWRIGLVDTPGGRAVVYFHPRLLNEDDLNHFETCLRTEIRRDYTLVLTANGKLQYRNAKTCTLPQMVHLELGAAHMRQHDSVAEAVGAPPKQTGGRPSRLRDRVLALISNRAEQGLAKEGRNEEAKAVIDAYEALHPKDAAPKLPTVKAYVSNFRSG